METLSCLRSSPAGSAVDHTFCARTVEEGLLAEAADVTLE
jgi:hypothetical protein